MYVRMADRTFIIVFNKGMEFKVRSIFEITVTNFIIVINLGSS